jgi:hypothetical protein
MSNVSNMFFISKEKALSSLPPPGGKAGLKYFLHSGSKF